MRNLLARPQRDILRELAQDGTLVVLDFDGTLAPIVRHASAARLSQRTRGILAEASQRFELAILSGRSVADVRSRVAGLDLPWIVGNHGAEWPDEPAAVAWRRLVAGWSRSLRRRLVGVSGLEIEEKGVSLSIHWRGARSPGHAGAAAREAAARLPGATLVPGKRVLNVLPAGAGDKGTALRRLVVESGCRRVMFVGDDATDEAAFRASVPNATMVRVGKSRASAAPFYLARRGDVDRLLDTLVGMRASRIRGRGER